MTHWAHTKSVKRTSYLAIALIWVICMVAYWVHPACFAGIASFVAAKALVYSIRLEVEVFPPEE